MSGLTAVARALGKPIKPVPPERVAALVAPTPASAVVRPGRTWSSPRSLCLLVPVAAAFLATLFVRPQLEVLAHIDLLARLVGLLVLPVAACVLWLRLRCLWLVTRSPHPGRRTVVASSFGPGDPRALRRAVLHVGDDAVMFRAGGREVWVAGPLRDGIVSAVIGGEAIHLLDASGVVRLVLLTRGWRDADGSTSQIERALVGRGIDVETTPIPLEAGLASDDPDLAAGGPWISPGDLGAVLPGFGVLLLVTSLIGAGGLTDWIAGAGDTWGFVAAAVSVVLVVGPAAAALAVFAWSRMQPRAGRS